jgi:hypothetical protein
MFLLGIAIVSFLISPFILFVLMLSLGMIGKGRID